MMSMISRAFATLLSGSVLIRGTHLANQLGPNNYELKWILNTTAPPTVQLP
jgi:protein tyrosine/serine phosphatase